MKKLKNYAALISLIFICLGCNKEVKNQTEPIEKTQEGTKARIKTVHGDIVFKFYPEKAPNTVKRIQTLMKESFYDGLTFHRVVPGFVAQGGDPTGTGRGGSGKKLQAEFNDLKHVKGTVAMARAQSPDSADSQFYICLAPTPHLDGNYTIFGQVIEGLEILDKITVGDKMISVTLEK